MDDRERIVPGRERCSGEPRPRRPEERHLRAVRLDFTYRFLTAPTKRRYLLHDGGTFDLLACVPGLRVFRFFRIVRAVRVVRRLGGPHVFGELRKGLASGTLYLVVFLGLATLELVGLLELHFERDAPNANITTAGDALWWGYVTATPSATATSFP